MDPKALFSLSYGLFVLTSQDMGRDNGCIINTLMQVTSNPNRILIGVNKTNYTHDLIVRSGRFNASVLAQSAPFEVYRHFGFQSGRDTDKIGTWPDIGRASNGITYLTRNANAYFSCKVVSRTELETHSLFLAEIEDMAVLSSEPSVTYAYYHASVKPKPSSAPLPQDGKKRYRCKICGYILEGDLDPDFICPVCKHGAQDFEIIEDAPASKKTEDKNMKKWKCLVCGEIVYSETRPEQCPLCKAPGEKFVEVVEEEEMTWATEHEVGVAKGAPEEIIEGLRSNFTGECTEVGMYLAMARVAFREGYPEIGEYWKTAAFEEAEHAAKFAELLGEVLTDSTKKNLEMRVAAENGATAGKFELAKKAKALNLDAIHDTVHEMAKDEARHGKAFKGLLERYFGK